MATNGAKIPTNINSVQEARRALQELGVNGPRHSVGLKFDRPTESLRVSDEVENAATQVPIIQGQIVGLTASVNSLLTEVTDARSSAARGASFVSLDARLEGAEIELVAGRSGQNSPWGNATVFVYGSLNARLIVMDSALIQAKDHLYNAILGLVGVPQLGSVLSVKIAHSGMTSETAQVWAWNTAGWTGLGGNRNFTPGNEATINGLIAGAGFTAPQVIAISAIFAAVREIAVEFSQLLADLRAHGEIST